MVAMPDVPGLPEGLDLPRLLAALEAFGRSLPAAVPLVEWRARVLELYASKRPTTRGRMVQALRELLELAGPDATTADLTPGLLDRFTAASVQAGRRSETTQGLLRAIRAACNLAVRWRLLAASPFEGWAGWPDEDDARARHHSRDTIARVLAYLRERSVSSWEGHRLYALAATFAYTGLRRNEALKLRVEDLDLVAGIVHVRSSHRRRLKTRSSEAPVPVPRVLTAILSGWLPNCGGAWVFPGKKLRGPWIGGRGGKRPAELLRYAGESVGVEGFTPHSLRHSLATHLAGHWGLKDRQVQMVLRHAPQSSFRTVTERYLHPDVVNLVELVRGVTYDPA